MIIEKKQNQVLYKKASNYKTDTRNNKQNTVKK